MPECLVESFSSEASRHDAVSLRSDGAACPIRTDDLLITNQLLYQLSYTGNEDPQQRILKFIT